MTTKPRRAATGQPTAIRAAVYLRVSTDEQRESGLGIEAQRARCLELVRSRGWTVTGEYNDEGLSGTLDAAKRPQLARLLADAHAGRLDAVVMLSIDRLGRRTMLILNLADELARAGVQVVSCKEQHFDTTTAVGKMMYQLMAILAEFERNQTSERTVAALAARSRRDGVTGGRVPYGYVRDGAEVRVDPAAAATVREVFGLRRAGWSLRAIACALNDTATPTPYGGTEWRASSVASLLANRNAYYGGARGESAVAWPSLLEEA